MMLKAIHCNTRDHSFHRFTNIEDLREHWNDPDATLWLDMENPDEQDLARLAQELHLHPLAVEDASHEHQRPKVEDYDQFYFVVFYAVHLDDKTQQLHLAEIDMFLGKNYLVTVHEKPLPELNEVEQRWTRNVHKLEWGIGVLLYTMLDTIVDHYFPIVDALVDQAEALEDRMYIGGVRKSAFTLELLELKKQFLMLRRIAAPQRDVLNVLTNRDNPIFDEHVLIYFRDVYDHITRLADTVDIYRDQLSTAMDANLSIVSNELNKVMRTLTVASIILMVDALIASIYGMNFDYMPELHWKYAYFVVLLVMAALSILLTFGFRRLKWL